MTIWSKVNWVSCFLFLMLFPIMIFAQSNAVAGEATVDQVLGSLSEVVKDRTKQVGTDIILRQIIEQLCSKEVKISRGNGNGNLILYLGESNSKAPKEDHVFVESCKLLSYKYAKLTDPYFLKVFSRDTIQFGLRVSAKAMDAEKFRDAKMKEFGDYIFNVMQTMSHKEPDIIDLIGPTFELANKLQDDSVMRDILSSIGNMPETDYLINDIKDNLQNLCSQRGNMDQVYCQEFKKGIWFINKNDQENHGTDTQSKINCEDWFKKEGGRDEEKLIIFFSPSNNTYSTYRSKPCPDNDNTCKQLQLLVLFAPALQTYQCSSHSRDIRRNFRSLIYIGLEKTQYGVAIQDQDARVNLSNWYNNVTIKLKNEESLLQNDLLSNGLRLVALVLRAYHYDAEKTTTWLQALGEAVKNDTFNNIKDSDPLDWGSRKNTPKILLPLRDSVKDLLAIPLAFDLMNTTNDENSNYSYTEEEIRNLLNELIKFPNYGQSASSSLKLLEKYIKMLSNVLCKPETSSCNQEIFVAALGLVQQGFDRAADKNWVGLAMDITEISKKNLTEEEDFEDMYRVLRFSQTLMSMYEAQSIDDAKAIFESELEDVTRREMRYKSNTWSIDVAALVGTLYGDLTVRDFSPQTADKTQGADLFGLYAPMGVQFGYRGFGLLVYPLDLGAYLTGKTDSSVSSENIQWGDAVRFGLSGYYRFSASVPIVLGFGVDHRSSIDDISQNRLFGFVALELPLFLIH